MLSGRYRTDQLLRHFSDNDGSCTLCKGDMFTGNIEHLLMSCPALFDIRKQLIEKMNKNKNISNHTKSLLMSHFQDQKDIIQLILDASVLPDVIQIKQIYGSQILNEIFNFSRNWCYTIHRERLKLQGRWIH